MGPLEPLLEAGATVIAIARKDNPKKAGKWERLLEKAQKTRGRLICPLSTQNDEPASADDNDVTTMAPLAGADATGDLPELIQWLLSPGLQSKLQGMPVSIG